MTDKPTPHELWTEAGGDRDRYRALLLEHGHLRQGLENCSQCHRPWRHRHDPRDGRAIRTNIFGHDVQ